MTPETINTNLRQRIKDGGKALALTLVSFAIMDIIFLVSIWPDWSALETGSIPKSRYMNRLQRAGTHLRWEPIRSSIPKRLTRPFIVAEDSRFYHHSGIDWQALLQAIEYNWRAGHLAVGASTISQQTVKNLFLTHERRLLRKWHELVLTLVMELQLSKTRILTLYLNIAEFGRGIFGVQAAARHYFQTDFVHLTPRQAAYLAASLPSPLKHNPQTRTRFVQKRHQRIISILEARQTSTGSQSTAANQQSMSPAPENTEPTTSEPAAQSKEPQPQFSPITTTPPMTTLDEPPLSEPPLSEPPLSEPSAAPLPESTRRNQSPAPTSNLKHSKDLDFESADP